MDINFSFFKRAEEGLVLQSVYEAGKKYGHTNITIGFPQAYHFGKNNLEKANGDEKCIDIQLDVNDGLHDSLFLGVAVAAKLDTIALMAHNRKLIVINEKLAKEAVENDTVKQYVGTLYTQYMRP